MTGVKGKGKSKKNQKKESKSKSAVISPTFRIELSSGEIAEDWYGLTVRRSTRPLLKRPKEMQKIVDNLFPGLLLQDATKGEYDVAD